MLKNYLKTAFRNLSRNQAYTLLNVVGLALGIGCALVIFKVITFENSFDKHHSNFDNIYRIVKEVQLPSGIQKGMGNPHPVAAAIRNDFSSAKKVVRTHNGSDIQIDVAKGDQVDRFMIEEQFAFTESEYFDIFDVTFIAGNKATALTQPNTVVISQTMAQRFFSIRPGDEQRVLGRTINFSAVKDFEIVGVIQDPVEATNFPFHMLFEYQSQDDKEINPYFSKGEKWNSTASSTNTYILVGNDFDPAEFDQSLVEMVKKNYDKEDVSKIKYKVQPLAAIHGDEEYGNYSYVMPQQLIGALAFIAVFLVLTACINFINLATAQAANRSKEIGIRKAIGGYTHQLVVQFFAEVGLITFCSLFFALAIAEFMFVYLEEIIGTRLTLGLFSGFETFGFVLGLFMVVTFFSGLYPSLLLSRMSTVLALKNKITAKNNSGGLSLRKALVVTQFTISQFLIIGTVIISAQMDYFLTKDLGFEKEAIVKAYLPERNEVKIERMRQLLKEDPSISHVSFSLSSPTGGSDISSDFNYVPLSSEDAYSGNYKVVDHEYLDLYGIELVVGNKLEKNDTSGQVLINRKVADLMGFGDNYAAVIGEKLESGFNGQELTVQGVVENFHSRTLNEDFEYAIMIIFPPLYYEVAYKTIEGSDVRESIDHFEQVWGKVFPEYVMDWNFFDEQLADYYEQEQSISALMKIFSVVSVIIGCLGLYGLIAFIAANRKKEVGIRKVLGASVYKIIQGFSVEILVLVLISFAVAAPVAWYVLDYWLNNYHFRIDIGFEFFVLAFLLTLIIAIITISHRTISTALTNPATTLKDE